MQNINIKFVGGLLTADLSIAKITALEYKGVNILAAPAPLFSVALRARDGSQIRFDSDSATLIGIEPNGATYSCSAVADVDVTIFMDVCGQQLNWRISVENRTDMLIEWVDFPNVDLITLKKDGGIGEILFPYNEGVLVDSMQKRLSSPFTPREPEYPSKGWFAVFPNMICSQFEAYLFCGHGLYMGAHDEARGVKGIDFCDVDDHIRMRFRLFCGVGYGESFNCSYPIVWEFFDGAWQDAAEIYRNWFEQHLPGKAKKIAENTDLPEWYEDSPLVVTYPVRGIHDMDDMKPNSLFPYINALPRLDEIAKLTESRLLVLLMHWEGTAPWAPPYVWPPYGGVEAFNELRDALHERGHLMGVYCSGFGYTLQSNLNEYNMEKEYQDRALEDAMCAGPDGEVGISRICSAQRKGYDLCPASPHAREILNEAYYPLLESGVDYSQILDQNHGGGQYFCYSERHGHAPAPGPWMTENMQSLLTEWNCKAGKMLLGCESAAAEPFIGNLLFSDNRFELCWRIGQPVPLYSYIYHEYLRNFMGNQVSTPFPENVDTLRHRMAYSVAAGDCMTIALMPDGGIYPNWGSRDFSNPPDYGKTLKFAANIQHFYRETAKRYLYNGRMIKTHEFSVTSAPQYDDVRAVFPPVFSTAWEQNGNRCQIFVNPNDTPVTLTVDGKTITVSAMDAELVEI